MASKQPETSKIDTIIENYSALHQHPANRFIQWFCIPLLTFGLLGFIWSIPFPQLAFLGKYSGYLNWASFLIAFSIYYYLKVSPLLSYGILLMVFAFSAGIVTLEKFYTIETMGIICLMIFILGLILQFIGYRKEGKNPSLVQNFEILLNGPLWLMHHVFATVGIKR